MLKWIVIGVCILSCVYQAILIKLNDIAVKKPLPENVRDVYDEAEYNRFINYRNEGKRLEIIRGIVNTVITAAFLAFNLHSALYNVLPGNMILKTVLLMLIFEGFIAIIDIPFSYYDTFVIEEKYGMNKTTKKTFVVDRIKEIILGIALTTLIMMAILGIFEWLGNKGIIVVIAAAAVFVIGMNFLSMIFLKIFNKFTPLEEGELRSSLIALCEKYGVTVKQVSVMDASRRTTKANAFCTGLGNKKDIALYDNLVEKFTPEQIVAVFAHEFAHAKFRHSLKHIFVNVLTMAIYVLMIAAILNIPGFFTAFGFTGINYYFALALFTNISWPVLTLTGMLFNYFSRKHEYQADAFAAREGYGDNLASALKQLTRDNLGNLNPHPVIVALEYSHPTVSQRITAIDKIKDNK